MRIHSIIAAAALAIAALPAGAGGVAIPPWAQYVQSLPPYHPDHQVSGTVTSWGHGFLKGMMRDWEQDFHRFQPNVTFSDDLASSAAAMAGLYAGRANLGVLAREIVPMEVAAYQKMTGQKIFPVTVLTGSYADPDKLMALGIFVNRDNPLARLDFRQLAAIFGAQHLAGAGNIRTWGQLGLGGAWKDRPIHPYSGPAGDEAPAFYFSQAVMHGSTLWNGALRQLDDSTLSDGKHIDGYQRAVDAVVSDPDGIAVTVAGYHNPHAKLVAIAAAAGGPYVAPTMASVADRSYPLSRSVTFYINDGPKIPPDPAVVEFLRYVLSRDGQQQALREGDFLPLTPQIARAELAKLGDPAPHRVAEGTPAVTDDEPPVLELVRRIPVPQMTGTWDHLTVDPTTNRLFLSAQDQQMVYVVPLTGTAGIQRITAGFDRPQGELYVPGADRLVVTNGRSARVSLIDGHDLRPAAALAVSAGADMIASDRAHGVLYVESGGTDSHRGPGWLAVIDPRSGRLTGRVTTGYRAAALVMAQDSRRLYVAIPALDQVAVIDTDTKSIVGRWRVPGRPASMALDEAGGRLFVATRTFAGDPRPPVLSVLDAKDGRVLVTLPSKDATENMFWDARHRLIYTSSLDGYVQAYRERDRNHYDLVATVRTVPHAGTSQLVPGLDELCVAAPPHSGQPAAVWIFRPAAIAMR